MHHPARRTLAALALGAALAAAHPSHAAVFVLDGSTGADYDAVGDGWFFAGGPGIPPDGVGDAGGNALAIVRQAGVVEIRAMAEFPLAPLAGVDPNDIVSATITYTIDDVLGGLGPGTLFDGTASDPIDVYTYSADGTVNVGDFSPAGLTLLASSATGAITDASLALSGPIAFDVDATQVVKDLLTNAETYLGVLLDTNDTPTGTSLDDLSPPGVPGGQLPFITVVVADPTTTSTTSTSTSTSSTEPPTTTSTSSTSTTIPATTDHPQDAVRLVLKARNGKEKLVWVSKTPALVFPATAPTTAGATLEVRNPISLETSVISLPAANWSVNGAGTVYKYKNAEAPGGPSVVKVSTLKSTVLRVVAKGTGITLDEATQGTVELVLTVGTDRYCASCSAPIKDQGAVGPQGQFVARGCAAPPVCP